MHPEKVTVWCEIWAGDVIGKYLWFQLDSAAYRTTYTTLDILLDI